MKYLEYLDGADEEKQICSSHTPTYQAARTRTSIHRCSFARKSGLIVFYLILQAQEGRRKRLFVKRDLVGGGVGGGLFRQVI